jgi:hypothetical protein
VAADEDQPQPLVRQDLREIGGALVRCLRRLKEQRQPGAHRRVVVVSQAAGLSGMPAMAASTAAAAVTR